MKDLSSHDNDLIIMVYQLPFGNGSKTLASAFPVAFHSPDNFEKRPQVGVISLNFALLHLRATDVTDPSRDLFEILVHQTRHILGLSARLYDSWIDRTTEKPYENTVHQINSTKYPNKTFNLIVTPKLNELVTEKFGIKEFNENNPVGVEMEDSSLGTIGSHFKLITYFTELMCAQAVGVTLISQFSLGALYDTGWYDVNFSKAEPFTYGEYRSVLDEIEPYKKFAFEPPSSSFPSNYLSTSTGEGCSYDHTFGGSFYAEKYNCSSDPGHVCCRFPSFVDNSGRGVCNPKNHLSDYFTSIFPSETRICSKPDQFNDKINKFKQKFGKVSFCAELEGTSRRTTACYKMIYSEANELIIFIENKEIRCNSTGINIKLPDFDGYSVVCPDPKIICGVKNYLKNFNKEVNDKRYEATISDSFVIISTTETIEINLAAVTGVVIGTLVLFLFVAIFSIICVRKGWCKKYCSANETEKDNKNNSC